MAEAAEADGDLFSAVKLHLLSTEPENALQLGIDHVKGTEVFAFLSVRHLHLLLPVQGRGQLQPISSCLG